MNFSSIRQKYVSHAHGKVLEVGVGKGINFSYYHFDKIDSYVGLDKKLTNSLAKNQTSKVSFVQSCAEIMPFLDNSFDTVVCTLSLCSVYDPEKSIEEIKRVLKSNGEYIFIEHILPSPKQGKTQNNITKAFNIFNGVWSKVSGGCNLNRRTDVLLAKHFDVVKMEKEFGGIACFGVAKNNKNNF